jgi:undecaprenyl-diphosphatase
VGAKERGLHHLRRTDAVAIGVAQAAALVPGVSRSGVTISAGLFTGLTRGAAARFSFLLGTPAILGAALVQSVDLAQGEEDLDLGVMLAGFVASALVGFVTIHFLMRFLATRGLLPFAVYRIALCLALAGWMLA